MPYQKELIIGKEICCLHKNYLIRKKLSNMISNYGFEKVRDFIVDNFDVTIDYPDVD